MSNTYKSSKKGRQVDNAIDYIEKLPQKLTDIELSIKETNNNKADKVSIPRNLGDLIDNITQQNYDANSSNPQSGKAVAEAIAKLLGSAPENLDTLEELAKALDEDENFSARVLAELAAKADAKTVKGGFNGGDGAVAAAGGAIGGNAQAGFGGAVGRNTYTDVGGAVGLNAKANAGGAIGWNAKAGTGFSGGSNAIAGKDSEDNYIDAIQLGMGTNNKPKTLQIYSHTLMNEDGTIPEERLPILKTLATIEYVDSKIGSGGGEDNSIYGFDYYVYGQYIIDLEGDESYYLSLSINGEEFGIYDYHDQIFNDLMDAGVYKIHIDNRESLMEGYPKYETFILIVGEDDVGEISQTLIYSDGTVKYRFSANNISVWNPWEKTTVTVDSLLSLTSINPVQNKVVKAELDKKATTEYVDEKIGDIDTLLDSVLAIEQELIGEALVDTSIAVCDSYINGGNAE